MLDLAIRNCSVKVVDILLKAGAVCAKYRGFITRIASSNTTLGAVIAMVLCSLITG